MRGERALDFVVLIPETCARLACVGVYGYKCARRVICRAPGRPVVDTTRII